VAALAALLLVAAPVALRAGEPPAAEDGSERRFVGVGRARMSHPQVLSIGIGTMIVRQPADWPCTAVCRYRGTLLQIEPGLGGAQASAGWATLMADRREGSTFLSRAYVGWGVKGAVLRTWGDAPLDPEDQTLIGVEGEFSVIGINFTLAVFRSLDESEGAEPWRLGGGLGWGF
jgi:hypothetical protein